MSRKEASFTQLYDYITRDKDNDHRYNFYHNFFSPGRDDVLGEFHRNSERLARRKNGNYLYHEVISISRAKNLPEEKQKELLREIIQQYVNTRAKDCLVFGGLHQEKDNNLHFHLIVSANRIDDTKRYRLSKSQFDEIKKGLEQYVLDKYPELEQDKLITADKHSKKSNNKEQELKRRTGKKSRKEQVIEKIRQAFSEIRSKDDFAPTLKNYGLEYYNNGKVARGFLNLSTSTKYRIGKLGLEEEFLALEEKMIKNNKNSKTHDSDEPKLDETTSNRTQTEKEFDDLQTHRQKPGNRPDEILSNLSRDRKRQVTKNKILQSLIQSHAEQKFIEGLEERLIGLHRVKDIFYVTDFETNKKYTLKELGLESAVKQRLQYKSQFHDKPEPQVKPEVVKMDKDLNLSDIMKETAKEFIFADFSHHEKRADVIQSQRRLEQWKKDTGKNKSPFYQSYSLTTEKKKDDKIKKAKEKLKQHSQKSRDHDNDKEK